jgi:uncharacterized protein (TIGR00297 family)
MQFIIGLICAVLISVFAYFGRSLTGSGAVAAATLGTIIFGFGGIPWAILLLVFFISSSLLTRISGQAKASLNDTFEKNSSRDHWQVMANGGAAGLLVILHTLIPQSDWVWAAYCASLAAVNADTWATEIGVLSSKLPILISNLKRVNRGTSGGVTSLGLLASVGGAFLIGLAAVLLWQGNPSGSTLEFALRVFAITLAGLAGSLVDSLLGATLQGIYFCHNCSKETERHPVHTCGQPTQLIRGLHWLNNDWVNTICAVTAALLGGLAGWYFPKF